MNRIIRRFFDASDSNARAGQTDNPPRQMEQEAVSRNAGRPGSMADAAGTSGDMDGGGGGIGHGMEKDPHLDKGDNGPRQTRPIWGNSCPRQFQYSPALPQGCFIF